jgi:U3 small nucleolar RNA-associated protein 7
VLCTPQVWDLRTYKELHDYSTLQPASSLDISQRGLLAVGHGPHVTVWRDALSHKQTSPYMAELYGGESIVSARFCPFEDILGVGATRSVRSLIVPGAGEPNFDALELNPFQTKKQRQESEVKALLDKIQPEMITLDPTALVRVQDDHAAMIAEQRKLAGEAALREKPKIRHRARGRSSAGQREHRKSVNVITKERALYLEKLAEERTKSRLAAASGTAEEAADSAASAPKRRSALDRFHETSS